MGVTALFSGLTITGGNADTGGGLLNSGTATLTNCTFSGNTAQGDGDAGGGGAIRNNSSATLINCTFGGNTAQGDPAQQNSRGWGVAIFNSATATLTNCTISGNSSTDAGGGVFNFATATLTNCTISGNTAGRGGGVANSASAVTLTNCTVSSNSAVIGGGLDNDMNHGTFSLTNCTISGNTASHMGGGLNNYQFGDDIGTAPFILRNTIVDGNTGVDAEGIFTSQGSNLLGRLNSVRAIPWLVSSDLIATNPLLAPLGNYGGPTQTMPPLLGSPATNAGSSAAGIPTTDQRGKPRAGATDIGAFELQFPEFAPIGFQPPNYVVNTTSDSLTPGPGLMSLPLAMLLASSDGAASTVTFDPTVFATNQTITQTNWMAVAPSLPGTAFFYQVSAVTLNGEVGASPEVGAANKTVQLSWNAVPGAISYKIYRRDTTLGHGIVGTVNGQTLTFTDSGGTPAIANPPFSAWLELRDTTALDTITGPAAGVTIHGGGLGRVFQIDAGVAASFSGLTITGGTVVSLTPTGAVSINQTAALTLENCTISGIAGVGIFVAGAATLENCTISGNTSTGAGGIRVFGTAVLTNCTISGNTGINAGVVAVAGSTVTLTNCTISGNTGTSSTGGINKTGGTVTLRNTIVAGNTGATAADVSGTFTSQGNNLIGTIGTSTGWIVSGASADLTGTNANPLDPKLDPLADNGGPTQTMALLAGSPAIDTGTNGAGIPTTDQRGFSRNGNVDIGAFEVAGVADTVAPTITLPANVTLEAPAGDTSPAATGVATATDDIDSNPSITFADVVIAGAAQGTFTIERTWTATDDSGNSATAVQTISVVDTTAPSITAPPDINLEATADITPFSAATSPTATGFATATDEADSNSFISFEDNVTSIAPHVFTIERTWTAIDDSGNSATAVQTISVVDTTAPLLTGPPGITLEAIADISPTATGFATTTDNADSSPDIIYSDNVTPISPNVFTIERTWTATDDSGNKATAVQTISVVDTKAPLLTVPPDLTLEAPADTSPTATGTATATDIADGSPDIIYADVTTPSPNGFTIARTWTATDDSGHADSAVQIIAVATPPSVTITVGAGPFTYNGSAQIGGSGTVTGAGGLNTSATLTYSANADGTGVADFVNAGTYDVTAHYAGDANHEASDGAAVAITINKASSTTITLGDGPFTYDGTTHSGGSGTVTGAGGLNTGATTLTYTGNQVNAGTYYVTAHYAGDANHEASDGAAVAIVINKVLGRPSVTNATTNEDIQTTSGLAISRNAADGPEVTHFQITGITNGTLFQSNGTTVISNGQFITAAQAGAGLKFTPAANLNSVSSTFGFTVQAATSASVTGLGGSTASASITVNAVNDAPVASGSTVATPEDVFIDVDLATLVSDVETPDASLIFSVSNPVNGTVVLQPDGHTARFTPTAQFSGTASFKYTVQDTGDGPSAPITVGPFIVTVNVTIVNDAPVVATTATSLVYKENQVATRIDPLLTIADADNPKLGGATVQITSNYAAGQDFLRFVNQLGIRGTFNAATGTLTLTGLTTIANYRAALRTITYRNTSNDPSPALRTVTFSVSDGSSVNPIGSATRTITVTPVNDAPTITAPGGTLLVLKNTAARFTGATLIRINDADARSGEMKVTLRVTHGILTLTTIAGLSFDAGFGDGTKEIRMTGTRAAINAALNGLRYKPTTNYVGLDYLRITADDFGNTGTGGPKTAARTVALSVLAKFPVLGGRRWWG